MHDKAIEAALAARGLSIVTDEDAQRMRRAVAAFLRAWKPDDHIATRAERERAKRLAKHTASELEQP